MADWPTGIDGQQATSSTITGTTYGVTVTADVSTNTYGAWTEMSPALPFDTSGVYLQIVSANSAVGYALDIGIGNSPNEVAVIPAFTWAVSRANYGGPHVYFPLSLRKGVRVAARVRATAGSAFVIVNLLFIAAGFSSVPPMGRVTGYGVNLSGTSTPTTIDPGGTANTKGSWVTLGPTTNRIRWLVVSWSLSNAATASTLWTLDIGMGTGSQVVVPDLAMRCEVTHDEVTQQGHSLPISIPAGVDLKVRAKSSITDATDRLIRIALYGVD